MVISQILAFALLFLIFMPFFIAIGVAFRALGRWMDKNM